MYPMFCTFSIVVQKINNNGTLDSAEFDYIMFYSILLIVYDAILLTHIMLY